MALSSTEMVNCYLTRRSLLHRIFCMLEYCVLFGNHISSFNLVKYVRLHGSLHLTFVRFFYFFFHMFLCSRFTLRTIINFHRLFSCKHIQCNVCRQAHWQDASGNCQKVAVFILRNGKWLILQSRLFPVTQFF